MGVGTQLIWSGLRSERLTSYLDLRLAKQPGHENKKFYERAAKEEPWIAEKTGNKYEFEKAFIQIRGPSATYTHEKIKTQHN